MVSSDLNDLKIEDGCNDVNKCYTIVSIYVSQKIMLISQRDP